MKFNVIDHFEWLKAKPKHYLDLASSGVHGPERLDELGVNFSDLPLSGGNDYGYPPLKEWLATKFGVGVDQIALAQGASGANFATIATLVNSNDQIVLETPVYQPMVAVAEVASNLPLKYFERSAEEKYRVDPEKPFIAHASPHLIIATNLHNPSGVYEPPANFLQIADRVGKSGGWLLVDEIFQPFLKSWDWSSLASAHDRIVTTGSLTKAWGLSGLRMGWVVGPKEVIYKIQRLLDYTQGVQSVFNEALALRLLEAGVADRLLSNARTLADSNRALVVKWLQDWGRASYVEPDGGVVLFARNHNGVDTREFIEKLYEKHNLLVTPGHFFRDPAGIRIGYSVSGQQVADWLPMVGEAFEDYCK